MERTVTDYLSRLKDRIYYLLVLKEREANGENIHFAEHAVAMSERMVGALTRYPALSEYDGFTDAIDAVAFCAKHDLSLQHVRTHILNSVNDVDRLIARLKEGA